MLWKWAILEKECLEISRISGNIADNALEETVSTINESSLTSCDASIVKLLLNGDESLGFETNTLILNATVDFVLSSKRFNGPLI